MKTKLINDNDMDPCDPKFTRPCNNCGKKFAYSKVRDTFPQARHGQLECIWENPEIKFYCSTCYFLKLIGILKSKKVKK